MSDNLLVIEAKKLNNEERVDTDIKKLRAFTDQNGDYGYRLGLFIVFDVEKKNICKVKSFKNGGAVEFPPVVKDKLEALGHGE